MKLTVIRTMSGSEFEVDRRVGEQVRVAWTKGAKTVSFDDVTLATSTIAEIEDIEKPDRTYMWGEVIKREDRLIEGPPPTPATSTSPGYLKYIAAKKRLMERM